jgi:hypothetical protein
VKTSSPQSGGEGLRAGRGRFTRPAAKTQRAPRRAPFEFAESISLSSTGSADLRLPPTAFASGFDLLALRARRKRESRRGRVLPQEVRKTKRAQFAEIQFSTFPQQTLQLVERSRGRAAALLEVRSPRHDRSYWTGATGASSGTCREQCRHRPAPAESASGPWVLDSIESRTCRTCLDRPRSTAA